MNNTRKANAAAIRLAAAGLVLAAAAAGCGSVHGDAPASTQPAAPAASTAAAPAMTAVCTVGLENSDPEGFSAAATAPAADWGADGFTNAVQVQVGNTSGRPALLGEIQVSVSAEGVLLDSGTFGQGSQPWIGSPLPQLLSPAQQSTFVMSLPLAGGGGTQMTWSQFRQASCSASAG